MEYIFCYQFVEAEENIFQKIKALIKVGESFLV